MVITDRSYPASDEIEVTILGGGNSYGESILIHCKYDYWVLIDSLVNPISKTPLAKAYLESISDSYSDKIKLVVATHWHDDHIKGIEEIIRTSNNLEKVCISQAVRCDEFLKLTQSEDYIESNNSGIKEFKKVLDCLTEKMLTPTFLLENTTVHQNISNSIYVNSLSPSSKAIINSFNFIKKALTQANERKAIIKDNPNDNSIVLHFRIDDQNILLGADLEDGWEEVMKTYAIGNTQSQIFKIPHHGSKTSYCEELWLKHFNSNTIGLITPWKLGVNYLPTQSDIDRIKSHDIASHITSHPNSVKIKKRDNKVNKVINELDFLVREQTYEFGVVRLRKKLGEEWRIQLFGSAMKLDDVSF